MKFRIGFVTNSLSSSFLCIAKIDYCEALKEFFKEEFGNYGMRLLQQYIKTGKQLKDDDRIIDYIEEDYIDDNDIDDKGYYLSASFVDYTNEGDTDGDDAWLYEHIPSKYKEEIYSEN